MKCTKIEQAGRKQSIYLNDEFYCYLYMTDVRKLKIFEGKELSKEDMDRINEILYNRAKERCLYYLDSSMRTEKQIKDKLREWRYPKEISQRVVEFLKEYRMIDDLQYATDFVEYHKSKRSVTRLKQDLIKKGISSDIISEVIEESEIDDGDIIADVAKSKLKNLNLNDRNDVSKLIRFLASKGFKYGDIKSYISDITDEIYEDY